MTSFQIRLLTILLSILKELIMTRWLMIKIHKPDFKDFSENLIVRATAIEQEIKEINS
jgi:hypothetical protein